jgi:toxin ParE1/3/4
MKFEVLLTESAAADLESIYDYIEAHEGVAPAQHVLDRFDEAFASLERLPRRGNVPAELAELGIDAYREIRFKPYRMIYAIEGQTVVLYLIADGRRDMRTLLERRLLG